jgi:ABC-type sugar transport system ATPase subunit
LVPSSSIEAKRRAVVRLRASGIVKEFPGVRALDGVDLDVRRGEVHALVGENGAGKSTLVKILGGGLRPTDGTAELDGDPLPLGDPVATRARGLGIIYQETTLVPELSVAENVFLGQERTRRLMLDRDAMREQTGVILARLGVACDARTPVRALGVGLRQLVEVARALVLDAKVLIFDEPTTALTDQEVGRLFATIRELAARGLGVVYISHRLDEVFQLANRVTVLRDGRTVATADIADIDRRQLIHWMVGRDLEEEFPRAIRSRLSASAVGKPVLELQGLGRPPFFQDVSLSVGRAEIVGLAGLVGAGRSSVGLSVFGVHPPTSGRLLLKGKPVSFRTPNDALDHGVGYLPEDRKSSGIFPDLGVGENIAMPHLEGFGEGRLIDRKACVAAYTESAERFRVRAAGLRRPIRTLSGGNQQKALLARLLMNPLRALVLDEPTRGVDVGARSEIYQILRDLVADGLAVLMISSELEELLGMCDRIAVMCEGRTTGILRASEATQERIMELATPGAGGAQQ